MEKAIKNREILYGIRDRLFAGDISYEEAKKLAAPIIADINTTAIKLAKKYNTKPQLVSFHAIMR